jgi:hypothetical protein
MRVPHDGAMVVIESSFLFSGESRAMARKGLTLRTVRDDDELLLMSDPWLDSDWPVYFVIRLIETDDYDREWARRGKYHVELSAVAPGAVGPVTLRRAAGSYGMDPDAAERLSERDEAELLHSCGIKAPLWQKQGNNRGKLLRAARAELAMLTSFTFGFRMDCACNGLGETGWDWIAGGPGDSLRA